MEELPGEDFYQKRLQEFVDNMESMFTIEDVIDFLGYDQNGDGTYYAMAGITQALKTLGCRQSTCFIPPRRVTRDEIIT